MLSLCLPRRIFESLRYNRYPEIRIPYDGSFRAQVIATVQRKHPRLDICDFPSGVVVDYRAYCPDFGKGNCIMGRCTVSIVTGAGGDYADDGLPIAVITFM